MPLIAPEIKAKFQQRIFAGLQRVYGSEASQGTGYTPEAEKQWRMLADAISDIAMDLVAEIQTNATVLPGIQVIGAGGGVPGPVAGSTVSPGKIA